MIVDIHTHFINSADFGDKLIADMKRCNIDIAKWTYNENDYMNGVQIADKVIVFGLKAPYTGWNCSNEYVFDFVKRHADKFIYFASIDPSQPDYKDDLIYNHVTLNCRGVKIGAVYQGVHPCDKRYYDIYSYCQKHNLPIITHSATTFSSGVPIDYARPFHIDRVSCDFPQLKLVIAHLGHPWEAETLAVVRKQENVYADLSALYYRPWQFYNAMMLAVEYGCYDKILFGSDFPATTTEESISGLKNINNIIKGTTLPIIPESVIDSIIYRNSLEILL